MANASWAAKKPKGAFLLLESLGNRAFAILNLVFDIQCTLVELIITQFLNAL